MAGGSGSGIIYKVGEGYTSVLVAVMGFASSLVAIYHGPFKPAMDFLKASRSRDLGWCR